MIQEIISGVDAHQYNAETFFGNGSKETRQIAKVLGFRMIYGGSPYAFFMDPNMPKKSLEEWEDICTQFYKKYSGLKYYQESLYNLVCRQGWYQSFTGRRYTFHKENGTYSRPAICNYIVQGTATGDIVPLVILLIRRQIMDEGLDAMIISTVHDSITLDVSPDCVDRVAEIVWTQFNNLPRIISSYFSYPWQVPLTGEVEVGESLGELTKIWSKTGKIA